MKTVEERAEEYAEKNFSQADMSIQLAAGAGYQAGYKAGASTQRIIEQEVRLKKSEDVTQGEYSRQNSFFMGWYFKRKGYQHTLMLLNGQGKKQLMRLANGLLIILWRQAIQMIGCVIPQIWKVEKKDL